MSTPSYDRRLFRSGRGTRGTRSSSSTTASRTPPAAPPSGQIRDEAVRLSCTLGSRTQGRFALSGSLALRHAGLLEREPTDIDLVALDSCAKPEAIVKALGAAGCREVKIDEIKGGCFRISGVLAQGGLKVDVFTPHYWAVSLREQEQLKQAVIENFEEIDGKERIYVARPEIPITFKLLFGQEKDFRDLDTIMHLARNGCKIKGELVRKLVSPITNRDSRQAEWLDRNICGKEWFGGSSGTSFNAA